MAELKPCKELELVIRGLFDVFGRRDYWLGFGGLWGLVCNNGIIPDGDLDICMLYPRDVEDVIRRFSAINYSNSKVIENDQDGRALYAGFNRPGYPHICVSFWYPFQGIRYFCHDEKFEMQGRGVPPSGYFFKGVPAWAVENTEAFHMVDWPGLPNGCQIRVPIWPGVLLDHCYPLWAFRKQRYVLEKYGDVRPKQSKSYHHGGAISPYRVQVKSMAAFANNPKGIQDQIAKNQVDYFSRLKTLRVRG